MGLAGGVKPSLPQILRSLTDTLEDFFNNIQQAVLDRLSLALELPPEGGVAQYLLVAPEFVHGNLLQLSRVVSA